MITEHLIRKGFKRIALITLAPHISITKERLQGYKDALLKNKIVFDKRYEYDPKEYTIFYNPRIFKMSRSAVVDTLFIKPVGIHFFEAGF